jgi:hypothetical protein
MPEEGQQPFRIYIGVDGNSHVWVSEVVKREGESARSYLFDQLAIEHMKSLRTNKRIYNGGYVPPHARHIFRHDEPIAAQFYPFAYCVATGSGEPDFGNMVILAGPFESFEMAKRNESETWTKYLDDLSRGTIPIQIER